MEKEKGISILLIVLIVGFICAIFIAGYFLFTGNMYSGTEPSPTVSPTPVQTTPAQTDPTANWGTLNNTTLGFQLKYPVDFFDAGHEPKVSLASCNYQVFPAQCPTVKFDQSAGTPSKLTIGSTSYCLYQTGDAGAGHQYYYDYYVTVKNQKCLVVELDSATTTCENYLPLQTGNTEQEQNYNACVEHRNSRPSILQQIASTFTLAQ